MKKLLTVLLAVFLVLSLGTVALAEENQDAAFSKTYSLTNEGTSNPAETFTFTFTPSSVEEATGVTVEDMPAIPNATVDYDAGTATKAGLAKTVDVALADIEWPNVGIYVYEVKETAGNTAGLSYDNTTAYLKVTVVYDKGTDTYYTAFVTLSLADENEDGITDVKTAGFTNTYSAGSLAISKTVTGNMGDQNQYFKVTVTLTGEAGKTYADSYAVTGGTKIEDGSAACTASAISVGTPKAFYLKHDETITIANLPYGVTYTVVEDDYTAEAKGGYDAAAYAFDDANKKIDSAADTVSITNNKAVTVDTGIALDTLPYVLLLGFASVGLAVFLMKKRTAGEN